VIGSIVSLAKLCLVIVRKDEIGMSRKKLIFLDIDYTIYSDMLGVSKSAVEAIIKVRNNGHKIIFNTGRIISMLPKDILELMPDGFITSAGAHVEVEDRCIQDHVMKRDDLCVICNYLTEKGISFELSSNTSIFQWNEADDIQKDAVNKISYFDSEIPAIQISEDIGNYGNVIKSDCIINNRYSGEIFVKNINKATGIQAVLEYYSVNREDTIAFGDAPIDFEMLQFAGIGVAMGNASQEIKQVADMVTKEYNNDGIYYGFAACKLL